MAFASDNCTGAAAKVDTSGSREPVPWCPRCEFAETCGLRRRRAERGIGEDGCHRYSTKPRDGKPKPSRYKPKSIYMTRYR